MARTVAEVMNPELVSAREDTDPRSLRHLILAMGITAVPVLDENHRPVGELSLRDLVDPAQNPPPISRPAGVIRASATLEMAGEALARTESHHLVVVDQAGKAIGMVSAVDVLRGLLGIPARHPAGFPHFDSELGVSWTDDAVLALENLGEAPEGAGVIVLVRGGRGLLETPVWAEASLRVRTRLEELLSIPQEDTPALAAMLARGGLRFRTASVIDGARRERVVGALRERLGHAPLPAGVSVPGAPLASVPPRA
jgi:CBS domain-containing protein